MTEKKETKQEEQSLADFGWDNDNDFFGIEGTALETEEDVITKVKEDEDEEELEKSAKSKTEPKKEEKKKETSKEDEEESEEEDEVPFGNIESDDENNEGEGTENEDEEEETVSLEEVLKSEIFKHVDLEKEENLTPERISELVEEEIDAAIEEAFNGVKEEGGEQAADYLKFLASGGDPIQYHRLWKEAADAPTDLNVEDDGSQDEVITYYLKNYTKTNSKEDISDHLEWLEEKGKKKAYAEKYKKEIEDDFESRKAALLENQKQAKVRLEKSRKEAARQIKDTLQSVDKIGNMIITKKDKSGKLYDDITKASVKIGENRYITPVQAKIGEMFKDPEKLIQLAKFVMTDFDTTDIELEAATKVAKKVKKTLVTASGKKLSSQPKTRTRSLSDFF